jgi:hypothetical protein
MNRGAGQPPFAWAGKDPLTTFADLDTPLESSPRGLLLRPQDELLVDGQGLQAADDVLHRHLSEAAIDITCPNTAKPG